MDNEPLELVRRALAGRDGRNPRIGRDATRAVVMVDPFPNTSDVTATYDRGISLVSVITRLFGALIEQRTRWKKSTRISFSVPISLSFS